MGDGSGNVSGLPLGKGNRGEGDLMHHHSVKQGRLLRLVMIGSLLLFLMIQYLFMPSEGLAQGDFDCPITLFVEDCGILQSSETAMNRVGSAHVESYHLAATIELDGDTLAFTSSGSGDIPLQDGRIVAADIALDDVMFTASDTQFEGDGILRVVDGVVHLGFINDDAEVSWMGAEISAILPDDGFSGEFADLLDKLNDVPTVVTWARDEDFYMDGTSVAVFYMDFSVQGLLQSSVFVEWLAGSLTETFADSIEGDLVSPALVTAVVSELSNQFSQDIGDEYIFRITQLISLEDFLVQHLSIELDFTMDLGFLSGFLGMLDSNIPETLRLAIDFDATMGTYGGDVSIEAPETYDDISDDIIGIFDSLLTDLIAGLGVGNDNGNTNVGDDSVDLVMGESLNGVLEANGDPNRYRFEARAGDIVQIAIRADEASNLDTYLQLFDAKGDRLADNDDAFSPPSELNLGALDSYIEYEIEVDGDYFVEVSSVFAEDAGSYMLTLRIE